MIQMLTYSGKEEGYKGEHITINSMHDAQALDDFEINVINLRSEYMWYNNAPNNYSLNCVDDLASLATMIRYCKRTNVIIMLPMNVTYCYDEWDGRYRKSKELKDMLPDVTGDILSHLHPLFESINLAYENTRTKLSGREIAASFYFSNISQGALQNILLCSDKSRKPTAIEYDQIIVTTLDLKTYADIMDYLSAIGLLNENEAVPEWMEEIQMFDDVRQFEIIEQNNQVIRQANDAIEAAMESISKNKRYKSILYTSGGELVDVVFEILTEMLGCDLSGFEDKKKEDFLFDIDGHIFIGEIKGVNHNVKNENVSQLDVHYQSYIDDNQDVEVGNISAILIIDHQKNKSISNREPVHENQINLAKRNGSLIIETMTLLRLFEKYISEEMTREQCVDILKSNTGLLQI